MRRGAALPAALIAGFVLAAVVLLALLRPWTSLAYSTWPTGFEAARIARNLHAGLGYASPFLALPGDNFLTDAPDSDNPGTRHPQIGEAEPGASPTAWVTPPYVLLWWAVFALWGVYTPAAAAAFQVLQIAFLAAALAAAYVLVRRLRGEKTALLAVALLVAYPSTWYFAVGDTHGTALFVLLLVLSLLGLERALAGARFAAAGFGLLAALAVLTEPACLFFYLWLVPWAAFKVVRARRLLVVSAAAFALLIGPWLLRNLVVLRAPVPLKSNLPMELFYGNNEDAAFDVHRAHVARFPGWNEEERLRLLAVGEPEYARQCLLKFAMFLHERPFTVLRLTVQRVTWYWSYYPFRTTAWRPLLTLLFHLPLGILLCAVLLPAPGGYDWLDRALFGFFALFPLVYYATHLMIYRYRYPLEALLLLAAASAWGRLKGWDPALRG